MWFWHVTFILLECLKDWCSFGSTRFPCNVTERMALNSAALLYKNREINQWTGNSCTNSSPGTVNTKPFQTLPWGQGPKPSGIRGLKLKSPIFTKFRTISVWSLTESDTFTYTTTEYACIPLSHYKACPHFLFILVRHKRKSHFISLLKFNQSTSLTNQRRWAKHKHTGEVMLAVIISQVCTNVIRNNGGITEKYKIFLICSIIASLKTFANIVVLIVLVIIISSNSSIKIIIIHFKIES